MVIHYLIQRLSYGKIRYNEGKQLRNCRYELMGLVTRSVLQTGKDLFGKKTVVCFFKHSLQYSTNEWFWVCTSVWSYTP